MSATLRSVPSLPVLPGKHTNPRSVKHPKHIDPKNNVQKTAMKMLKREELNAKRSRLEALLSQQFIAKYGGKRGGGARFARPQPRFCGGGGFANQLALID